MRDTDACWNYQSLQLALRDPLGPEDESSLAEHLERCSACRERLEELAADRSDWTAVRELEIDGGPEPGQVESGPPLGFLAPTDDPAMLGRLGPYEIQGVVGHGGMGIVLKGFDRALNRNVAIKVLAPQLAASVVARRRFAREARAAAAVVHEHVVPIHAVAEFRGLPYLVMPYFPGKSLQRRIDETGPLATAEILRIGRQIAAGLAAAHAQGLVHRDIKPANILLENGVERVVITDFGLARTFDDASLTCSGVIAGTPQYMAPEQARGDSIDHRSDLFSLGSVMYAMCTGRPPFRAGNAVAVLRRICDEEPRPIREINPEVPEWLARVIERLHEKEPQERYEQAEEVSELLERCLAHVQNPMVIPLPAELCERSAERSLIIWRARGMRWIAVALITVAVAIGMARFNSDLVSRGRVTGNSEAKNTSAGPELTGAADESAAVLNVPNGGERIPEIRGRIDAIRDSWSAVPEWDSRELERWIAELRSRADRLEGDMRDNSSQ